MIGSPVKVEIAPEATLWHRLEIFFGHFDFRVYLTETGYVDVGRGSLSAALWVVPHPLHEGSLGSIGQFCEFAECRVMSVGDHENDLPVNLTFNAAPVLQRLANDHASPLVPVEIGNAVVISIDAIVLPGNKVGDGAVVGAGAVVTKNVEPFTICGGVPAKKIGDRPDAERVAAVRWWDWSTPYLMRHMRDIQTLALRPGDHEYHKSSSRVLLRVPPASDRKSSFEAKILGVIVDGETKQGDAIPVALSAYIKQAFGPNPTYWLPELPID